MGAKVAKARNVDEIASIHEGITQIISPDTGFDLVHDVTRLDPTAFAATLG